MQALSVLNFGIKRNKKEDPKKTSLQTEKEQISSTQFPNCIELKRRLILCLKRYKKLLFLQKNQVEDNKKRIISFKIDEKYKEILTLKKELFHLLKYEETEIDYFDFKKLPLCSFEEISKLYKNDNITRIFNTKYEFQNPTPIQSIIIPYIKENFNIIASSATGSGKTIAYLLPVILKLNNQMIKYGKSKKCLVILPTKELCTQIYNESVLLSSYINQKIKTKLIISSLISSCSNKSEYKNFITKNNIFIGTPDNIFNLLCLYNNTLLKHVKFIIFDEADRVLDVNGFNSCVEKIFLLVTSFEKENLRLNQNKGFAYVSKNIKIVKCFFSATFSSYITDYIESKITDIKRISIGSISLPNENISQVFTYCTNHQGKIFELSKYLTEKIVPPVLVFVDSIENGKRLFEEIKYIIPKVNYINSHMTKESREELIKKLRIGEIWVLITSDLISRGIDFKNIKTVINFDCPENSQTYIHRIGRTGRAGNSGESITYIVDDDKWRLVYLKEILNSSRFVSCPEWMKSI